MGKGKRQEFFRHGLTEEIITAPSKTLKLFVSACNSTIGHKPLNPKA